MAKDARKSGRSCETRQDKTKFEVQSAKDKAQRERVPNKLQLNESLFYFNLGVLGFWGFGVLVVVIVFVFVVVLFTTH